MGVRKYDEDRAEANKRYDQKTYRQFLFKLRIEEDAEIIESLERAKEAGMSNREWLSAIFYKEENRMIRMYKIYEGYGEVKAKELLDADFSAYEALAMNNDNEPELVTSDKAEAYRVWEELNEGAYMRHDPKGFYELHGYYMEAYDYDSQDEVETDEWEMSDLLETSDFGILAYEGKEWGDIDLVEQELLLSDADAIDLETGDEVDECGECIVILPYPMAVAGRVEDGEIVIDDEAVIYKK